MSSISSITSSSALSYIAPTTASAATQQTDAAPPAGGTQLSKLGGLMSKLQDLSTSDPAKAKEVLAKISQDLKTKADATGDSKMSALADKFNQASQTGDLSALQPKGGGGHHHHHGGGGGHASSASQQVGAYQDQQAASGADSIESIISADLSS